MKTELPQDSPVCFHDFSVADESIAWSSCSSAGLASSSIHGAKLTLSLESTSFRLHNVALRFGIYKQSAVFFAKICLPEVSKMSPTAIVGSNLFANFARK